MVTGTLKRHWRKSGSGSRPPDFADTMYIREIELQCEFAQRSFGQMLEIYAINEKHASLLALSHMLLVFAGNVAKLLTFAKDATPKSKARALRICDVLNLKPEDFSTIRRARNYFEHFDERMDKYIGGHNGLIIQRLIEDHEPSIVTLDDGRTFVPAFMQLLNTMNWELTLYGEKFSLPEILQFLQSVQASAQLALNNQGIFGYKASSP